MIGGHRQALYWAFVLHRLSGVVLALFLPVHLYVLGLALDGAPALDRFLEMTETPLAGLAQGGLVVLLALHFTGGLRLLALEFLPWRDWQKSAAALAGGASLGLGLIYLLVVPL